MSSMAQLQKSAEEFTKEVEQIGGAAEKTSRKTSGFFSAVKAGASGAKSSVAELGGILKSTLATAATLGGALSIGAAIHGAQAATSSYKDLAFAIRVGTGAATSWQDVQQDVEASAGRWKRSNKEVQDSYAGLFSETGNADFSKAAMDAAGMSATATGKAVQTWSDIAGTLNEKFGIGASGINDALAAAVQLTNKGGASAEELASKLGLVGASAKLLGLQGEEGFKRILGMVNMADDATGTMKQKFGAVSNVLEQMADPERLKAIEKALGVKLTDPKGAARGDAIQRIIAKTKGDEGQLRKAFGNTEVKLVSSMAKPFVEAFAAAKGTVQQRTAAALDAYSAALGEAAKTTFDGAALQNEATSRLADAPRNMQKALNDFQKVFERPEMVRAVDQAAEAAPKLAGVLASIVSFAANHPLLAAGGVVGGAAVKGAVTGAVTKLSEDAMSSAGKFISSAFAAQIKADGAWGAAGKAFGVAAAALIAYEIGKAWIDRNMDQDENKLRDNASGAATVEAMVKHGTGSPAERAKAAEALRTKIEQAKKDGGPSGVQDFFGSYASKLTGVEHPVVRYRKNLANMEAQLAALEKQQIDRGMNGPAIPEGPGTLPAAVTAPLKGGSSAASQKLAREVVSGEGKVTISNEAAMAQAFARAQAAVTLNVRIIGGGGNGTNGLPPAPGTDSGSTPR
jgi:hypothetical protein